MGRGAEDPATGPKVGFVAFSGASRLAAGALAEVALAARRARDLDPAASVLIFHRASAEVVEVDLRGSPGDILARLSAAHPAAVRRGRPRLGVVAREVTLLPRHWDWLARQPGGASVTLRKLVETASKSAAGDARERAAAAYRFMAATAGDLPGFEEAARALFANDRARFQSCTAPWPPDIRDEALRFFDARRGEA